MRESKSKEFLQEQKYVSQIYFLSSDSIEKYFSLEFAQYRTSNKLGLLCGYLLYHVDGSTLTSKEVGVGVG